MGDRTSASISIGGLLSHALTPDLIHAIRADGGRADWEGSFLKSGDIVTGQVIEAHAFDLNGGIFDITEDFCVSNGIPFVRTSGSCSGVYGPEKVVHTGNGVLRHFELNENGSVIFSFCEIQSLGTIDAIRKRAEFANFLPPPISMVENAVADIAGGLDNG